MERSLLSLRIRDIIGEPEVDQNALPELEEDSMDGRACWAKAQRLDPVLVQHPH